MEVLDAQREFVRSAVQVRPTRQLMALPYELLERRVEHSFACVSHVQLATQQDTAWCRVSNSMLSDNCCTNVS